MLNAPGITKKLKLKIKKDIDKYCIESYYDAHRWHLGASQIGDECKRKLWYVFRWCKPESEVSLIKQLSDIKKDYPDENEFSEWLERTGRIQRLFNRGHREEDRFIEWLEGIGFQVWADDLTNNTLWFNSSNNSYRILSNSEIPNDDYGKTIFTDDVNFKQHVSIAKSQGVKFPQYKMSDVNGHFGGSLDGIAKFPERYGISEPILLEFKTNGTGRGFNKLLEDGMIISKPQHFAQTSTYGEFYGLNYVLYLNICKNDDNIHIELVKLDHNLGKQMRLKAEQIISSKEPPPKISESSTFFQCKICDFNNICHNGQAIEKNCRNCIFANPIENAEWYCSMHSSKLPRDFVKMGCFNHKAII